MMLNSNSGQKDNPYTTNHIILISSFWVNYLV